MLIDTHCHLDFPEYDSDRDEVIQRAKEKGIAYIINIGSSLEGSRRSLDLAERYDCVYATVGIHPHEADTVDAGALKEIETLARREKVVAIGEIGLDYYKNYSKQANQLSVFHALIGLAKTLNLPLVIHSRQAHKETMKILSEAMPLKAVVHCFSGPEDFLDGCLALGFFVSFTCNITYEKAENLRRLLKSVPLERLFLETDAPFLPAQGYRGKRNEPWFVRLLAEELARIKDTSVEEVASVTSANAKNFFHI